MRSKRGLTFMEALIVLAIMGLLFLLALPMYYKFRERSLESQTLIYLRQLAAAQMTHQSALGSFIFEDNPENLSLLATQGWKADSALGLDITAEEGVLNPQGAFIIFAAHREPGSKVFVYESASGKATDLIRASPAARQAWAGSQLILYGHDPEDETKVKALSAEPLLLDRSSGQVLAAPQ